MTATLRTLAVCADDFGMARGISTAIATLARAERLTATTCITNAPHWAESAALLRDLPPSVEIGLHVNLTEGRPLGPTLARHWPRLPGLRRLIVMAHFGQLPWAALQGELEAQVGAFVDAVGRPPAFVDGHQHVHHLPVVRTLLVDLVREMRPMAGVRNTAHVLGRGYAAKRWLIEHTGGKGLAVALDRGGVPHNRVLLGAYGFERSDYRTLVRDWLARVPADGALLFCHPAQWLPGDPPDSIAKAREHEYAYLGSDDFTDDLAAANVRLGRVWRVRPATRGEVPG